MAELASLTTQTRSRSQRLSAGERSVETQVPAVRQMNPNDLPCSSKDVGEAAPAFAVAPDDTVKTPEISVIVVSWNARAFLEECLESLSSGVNRPYEVIVVENDSNDGSGEMVANRFPWVNLIQTGANLGFAKGNNIGIRHSRGQYIALVNSDVNVLPGCLDQLADFLDRNPEAGMVGPRIFYGDGRQQSSCRRFPSLWNNACEVFGLNQLFPHSAFFAGEHMFYFSYDRTCEVDVLVGCFVMARRSAVKEFGLLDEQFFMYAEDVDWSRRCRLAGWKIFFCADAAAIHYCGGSSQNEPLRFSVAQTRSRLRLWSKYNGKRRVTAFASLAALGHLARGVLAAFQGLADRGDEERASDILRRHRACLRVLISSILSSDDSFHSCTDHPPPLSESSLELKGCVGKGT